MWRFTDAAGVMRRALELAARGIGSVEPNPAVGAVLVDDSLSFIAEGWHNRFGGPHAEIEAINSRPARAAGEDPVCHARTLLPRGQNRIVRRGHSPRGHPQGRGGLPRSFP